MIWCPPPPKKEVAVYTLAAVIFALALAVVLLVTGAWIGIPFVVLALVALLIFANRRAVLNAQLPTSNVRSATPSTSEASYDPTGQGTADPSRGAAPTAGRPTATSGSTRGR